MSECYVKQVSFKKFLESIGVSSELNAGRYAVVWKQAKKQDHKGKK